VELREIKALIALMREHGLTELEIEDKKGKVRLVRGTLDHAGHHQDAPATASVVAQSRPAPSAKARQGQGSAAAVTPELAPNQVLVKSPMVGTFYRAASPGAEPFVEEGSPVRKGQPLCIIEAMKMMNEVEAEVSGSVVRILCENGQPVEYAQALMILQTA
jgi:acetyl-CoA carboxylase biotin carboxyl carrier protein